MRSKRYSLALMPYWVLAIAMGMASQAASAARCDVDGDRDIDRIDIVSIRQAVGSPASGVNDPRDGDGDGRILRNDEFLCALRCTLPLCKVVSGNGHANRRPLARPDSARTAENTSVRINVIANDRDLDGRLVAKSIRIVTRPKHGRVRNHRNGTVTYTPVSGFTGRDQFRYRVRDADHARSRAARVSIIVERGNHPPLADAGSDTNTTTGLPVTLNGSGSSDPDGDALTFLWRFLSVPSPSTVTDASLANGNSAAPHFTPDVDGPYELALEASDGAMSAVDSVIVAARAPNVPPNANAGPDANAVASQLVNLDGRGSADPDNGPAPLGFRWSFAAVPPGSLLSDIDIAGASTALASFTPDFAGNYRISLDVDDGADTGRDEVLIAAASPNVAPNADAGTDLVVQLGAGATLDGAASNDLDSGPDPLSFQWTFVSIPPGSGLTGVDLLGATTAAPSFTPDVEGFYLLRLDVSDGDLVDMDQVQVKANVAPVAVDDDFATAEDTSLNGPAPGVLGNDSDGTSDPLTAVLNTDVSKGTLTLNPNGSFTYTPDTDFQGTDSFTYRANDGTVNSTNPATVTITVNAVDDPPVALNDVATVNEDAPATTIAVLANDTDLDGGAKTITAVQDPSANGGTVLITNGGADLTYQPATDYCNAAPDTFTYTLSPGGSTATVSVTVNCVDDPPVAVNDAATVSEDAPATTIAVLANDTDLDIGAKTITAVQNPSANGGTVLITNGGADLTYQPAADYCNAPPGTTPDTFTYTLSPGGSIAAVSVTVNCVNDAPVIANLAGDILAYTQGDPATPIDQGGDAAATDVDSPDFDTGTLTVSLPGGLVAAEDEIGIRNQGTGVNQIGITGPDVTFNPGSGAVTIGSFSGGGAGGGNLVVTFNASAGAAAASALLHKVTYRNSNNTAPTTANRTVRFVLSDGDGGTSLDSDATIAITLNTPPVLTAGGANPTFTEDGAPVVLDGALTVTDANDTDLESATVRITAGFQTGQDLLGFVDAPPITGSFDPLTGILILTGSATLADYQTALRSVTYQNTSQNPNTAARSVAFVANDGSANSNTITKTVTVLSVNDAPSFTASNPPTILEDAGAQTVVGWATFNPGPPDESGQAVVVYTVSNISNGALFSVAPVVAANGTLTYTPAANVSGVSIFDVVVQDDGGIANGGVDTSAAQSFTITVDAVNNAPSFTKGADHTGNEDAGPQTVSPWASAIDDGDPGATQTLTFNVTGNTNPSLFSAGPSISPTGVLTYTPAANASGTANLTLSLSDDGGTANGGIDTSAPQSFTITVNPVNDTPAFNPGSDQAVDEDSGAQTVSGWASAISPGPADESGQTVNFSVTGNTDSSLFSAPPAVSPTGTLTYTPAPNAFGSATITLILSDNGGTANGGIDTSAPQSFTITIHAVNDAPSFNKGADQTVNEDANPQTVSPWATAIDDGDPAATQTLTFNVTGNTNPSLFSAGPSVSPTGVLTYTPAANASGTASITLTLSDDGGITNGGDDTSDPQNFTITVNAVNDAPSFTASNPPTVLEDRGAQTVSNWATFNAGPANESSQTVLGYTVSNVGNAALFSAPPAVANNGTLTYTPAADAFGTSTFQVMVKDDGGTANGGVDTSAPQIFTITVNAVNDAPSFTPPADPVAVNEDSGSQAVPNFVTGISPGPGESGQTVSFVIDSNTNSGLFSGQPSISATGALAYTPAANQNGTATITFHALDNGGIANGGVNTSSTQSFTITVNAVNDPPIAQNKTASAQANMKIVALGGNAGLLAGVTDADSGVNGCSPTFSVASITSNSGGTVSNVDLSAGTFDFDPNAGFTGTATVNYTVKDNGCPGIATSAAATISITVNGPVIWFVDSAVGGPGDGRLSNPFKYLSGNAGTNNDADDVDAANHNIFLFSSATTYTGGLTLNSAEKLIGQGATGTTFDAFFGISPPAGTIARPAINGARPSVGGTVTVPTNSTVRGLNVVTTGVTGLSGGAATGVTVNEASVSATNATAVNLNGTGGTFTFTRIDSSNASAGIVLNNTGNFIVTGTGTAGSGGTIQNTTTRGASFISAQNISLTNMNFTNTASTDLDADNSGLSTGDNLTTNAAIHLETVFTATLNGIVINGSAEQGINGHNVKDFTLQNSSITNAGNAADEDGIHFYNMLGTSSITNTTISSSGDDNINIQNNTNAALPAGMTAVLNLAITNGSANTGVLGSGYLMGIRGTSTATVTIDGVTANNNFSGGVVIDTFDTATSTIEVKNSTITNNNDGISLSSNNGSTKFDIHDNVSFAGNDFVRISILKAAFSTGGTLQGKIRNNPIVVADGQTADAISIFNAGAGALTVSVTGNDIDYRGTQRAILVQGGQDGNGSMDVTITGNPIDMQLDGTGNAVAGILAQAAITGPGNTTSLCADIGGAGALSNPFTHSLGGAIAAGDIRVRQRNNGTMRLPGYVGGATDTAAVSAYLNGRNTVVSASTATADSTGFAGGAACTQPVFP